MTHRGRLIAPVPVVLAVAVVLAPIRFPFRPRHGDESTEHAALPQADIVAGRSHLK
jgi:hypothetical protein